MEENGHRIHFAIRYHFSMLIGLTVGIPPATLQDIGIRYREGGKERGEILLEGNPWHEYRISFCGALQPGRQSNALLNYPAASNLPAPTHTPRYATQCRRSHGRTQYTVHGTKSPISTNRFFHVPTVVDYDIFYDVANRRSSTSRFLSSFKCLKDSFRREYSRFLDQSLETSCQLAIIWALRSEER